MPSRICSTLSSDSVPIRSPQFWYARQSASVEQPKSVGAVDATGGPAPWEDIIGGVVAVGGAVLVVLAGFESVLEVPEVMPLSRLAPEHPNEAKNKTRAKTKIRI